MLDTIDLEKHEISKITNFVPSFRMNKSWLLGDEPVLPGGREGGSKLGVEFRNPRSVELKL